MYILISMLTLHVYYMPYVQLSKISVLGNSFSHIIALEAGMGMKCYSGFVIFLALAYEGGTGVAQAVPG